MSRDKQIKEMSCKQCIHYEGCLKRFREAKKNGQYALIDEEEYFAHANECDMFITGYRKASEVAREIFENIRTKCVDSDGYFLYGAFMNLQLDTMKKYESEETINDSRKN